MDSRLRGNDGSRRGNDGSRRGLIPTARHSVPDIYFGLTVAVTRPATAQGKLDDA